MNIDYKKQATNFLAETNTTLKVERAIPQKSPLWVKNGEKHGINYAVTLENKNAKYTFDFWDSIKDREIIEAIEYISKNRLSSDSEKIRAERFLDNEKIAWRGLGWKKERTEQLINEYTPNEYDILACLSPLYEDNFEDFCSAYGYEVDSITALKTFEAVKEQDRNIRKLWDRAEIEKLSDIQ